MKPKTGVTKMHDYPGVLAPRALKVLNLDTAEGKVWLEEWAKLPDILRPDAPISRSSFDPNITPVEFASLFTYDFKDGKIAEAFKFSERGFWHVQPLTFDNRNTYRKYLRMICSRVAKRFPRNYKILQAGGRKKLKACQ